MSTDKRKFLVEIVDAPGCSNMNNVETEQTPSDNHKKLLERKALVTGRLSEQSRYVGFGIAIACFALLTSDSDQAELIVQTKKVQLVSCAIIGSFAVLFDIFQYFCGYISVQRGLNKGKKTGIYEYNRNKWEYFLQEFMFWLKLIVAVCGGLFLLYILSTYLCPQYEITNLFKA